MSGMYLFPFGQADCFLLELDCGKVKSHILIDGGSKRWSGASLYSYLEKVGVEELELMILTHLHQDHIGWLTEIAKNVKVNEAVLPISSEKLLSNMHCFQNIDLKKDFMELQELEKNLNKSGAFVRIVSELDDYYTFSIGDWNLTLIYPSKNIIMPFGSMLRCEKMVDSLISKINWDSMVWLLHSGKRMKALFCGDCPEECFLERFSHFKKISGFTKEMDFLKLSHHGRNDKGTVYFTNRIITETGAKKIIITNVQENIPLLKKEWGDFVENIMLMGEEEKWISF